MQNKNNNNLPKKVEGITEISLFNKARTDVRVGRKMSSYFKNINVGLFTAAYCSLFRQLDFRQILRTYFATIFSPITFL